MRLIRELDFFPFLYHFLGVRLIRANIRYIIWEFLTAENEWDTLCMHSEFLRVTRVI